MSDSKRDKVVAAATELFLRYGFKRTTMGDIAKAAEMSRPALYLVFSNKEEIFRAVFETEAGRIVELAAARLQAVEGLEPRLEAMFESWVVEPYQMISQSPEAQDLYETSFSFAQDLRERFQQHCQQQFAEAFRGAAGLDEEQLRRAGLEVDGLARLLAASTLDLKRTVKDIDELRALLGTAVRLYGSVV